MIVIDARCQAVRPKALTSITSRRPPNSDASTWADTLPNLRTLCAHHDAQIKELPSGKRRRDGKLVVRGCDANGWPIAPNLGWTRYTSLDLFREIYGGGRESHAGKLVNLETTLEDDTAYACMRVLSEGCSQVPWHLYQKTDGRRAVAAEHPLDDLLYRSPNAWGQTSFEFRETLMLHLLVAGNAYVFVNRVGRERKVRELIILEPRHVSVKQKADYSLE